MRSGLAVRLSALDRGIARLIEQAERLGPTVRYRRIGPGRWCPLELVEHLVLVHEGTGAVLRRTPIRLPRGRHPSWGRPMLLGIVLRSPLRIRAPVASVLPAPGGPQPLEMLVDRWRQAQESIREALERNGRAWGDGPVFRHPIAGWLDAAETLQFLLDHLEHHERQLTA